MKRLILTAGLASLTVLAVHAQQTTISTTPTTASQTTVQPGSTTSQQTQNGTTTSGITVGGTVTGGTVTGGTLTTGAGEQTQTQLPQTGQTSGFVTNQINTPQLKIQTFTSADQPVATQIQQVLTTEPVLSQTLPMVNIQVNGGMVILDGSVQCGAEAVLMQNLIQQRLPSTIRIDNRLRLPGGAFAPAVPSIRGVR